MRHTANLAIAAGLAFAYLGCSHAAGDPTLDGPPLAPSVAPAAAPAVEHPAGAPACARAVAAGADRVEEPAGDRGGDGEGECKPGEDDGPAVGAAIEEVPTDGASSRGPAGASITIVEFADYQCPFCARAEGTLHALEQAHPGDVRVVFKNMPLPFHDHARILAKAALAAGVQGKFWEMHDRLFAIAGPVDRAVLDGVARDLGLDVGRFDRGLDDAALEARIDADVADGKALGVKGTPTFFVDGRRIVGAQPVATFEQAIASAPPGAKR